MNRSMRITLAFALIACLGMLSATAAPNTEPVIESPAVSANPAQHLTDAELQQVLFGSTTTAAATCETTCADGTVIACPQYLAERYCRIFPGFAVICGRFADICP